jgi:hypothetical protein
MEGWMESDGWIFWMERLFYSERVGIFGWKDCFILRE